MSTLESRVDRLNAAFHEHVKTNSHAVARYFDPGSEYLAENRRLGLLSHGDLLPVPPALVPTEMLQRIAVRHRALVEALECLYDVSLGGSWEKLATALRLEESQLQYVDMKRRPRWLTVGRPDVVLHGDTITMVEPNAGSSCGFVADADYLSRFFSASPVVGEFLRKINAKEGEVTGPLVAHLRARMKTAGFSPGSAVRIIEMREDLEMYPSSLYLLADEFRRHGLRADVAAVEDLDVATDGVAHNGERCGLLYRFAAEEPAPAVNYPVLAPLLEAARSGAVVVADEIDDAIAAKKTVLALLSERLDANELPGHLSRVLRTFIPWTRIIEDVRTTVDRGTVELLDWCIRNQTRLVLKPGAGFNGRGVMIGCEVDSATWNSAVTAAVDSTEAWIVQELATSHPTDISVVRGGELVRDRPFVDYGYFAVGGSTPAAVIRKSAPFGTHTRRVKLAAIGPTFTVRDP